MIATSPFLFGLITGLSISVAVGPQSAFVLRQSIRREHVALVVAVCTACDATLVVAGVAAFDALDKAIPNLVVLVRYGGATFLITYGVLAAVRAARPRPLLPSKSGAAGRVTAIVGSLAVSLLNPHSYLDAVVVLGSLADEYGNDRWVFGVGGIVGGALWHLTLGFGGTRLQRLFASRAAWRVFDAAVAVTMIVLAGVLLLS